MALIGQHQQTLFSNPQNGQSPIDADVVRNNDNAVRAKLNAHDGDATIHVQTGLLASRPASSVVGAMYMDETGKLYRDTGATWVEVPYAGLANATNTLTGNLAVEGALAVDGTTALNNNVTVTGNMTVTGTVTAGSISGPTTVPASNVTAGTFPSGTFAFPGAVSAGSLSTGALSATSFTGSHIGNGSGLTSLPAGQLTGSLPAISGAALTNLNATNIASGTVNNAQLNTNLGTRAFDIVQPDTITPTNTTGEEILKFTATTYAAYFETDTPNTQGFPASFAYPGGSIEKIGWLKVRYPNSGGTVTGFIPVCLPTGAL